LPGFIDTYSPQFPIVSLTNYLPQGPVAGRGRVHFRDPPPADPSIL